MSTFSADLRERIAEEMYYDQNPEGRHRSEWPDAVYPDTVYEYRDLAAAAVMSVVTPTQDPHDHPQWKEAIPDPIADLIDAHRPDRTWSGNREKVIECSCGHLSASKLADFVPPVTEENSPIRDAERKHAQHVADVIRAQQEDVRKP